MKCPKCNEELQMVGEYCPNCSADLAKEAIIELQIVGCQIEEQKKIRENLESQNQSLHKGGLVNVAEEYRKRKAQLLKDVSEMENNLIKRISEGNKQSVETPVTTEIPNGESVQKEKNFCPYCGNRIDGNTFCGQCGKRVN